MPPETHCPKCGKSVRDENGKTAAPSIFFPCCSLRCYEATHIDMRHMPRPRSVAGAKWVYSWSKIERDSIVEFIVGTDHEDGFQSAFTVHLENGTKGRHRSIMCRTDTVDTLEASNILRYFATAENAADFERIMLENGFQPAQPKEENLPQKSTE